MLFSFNRQMHRINDDPQASISSLLAGDNMSVMLRGVDLTSSLQRGQVDDMFIQSCRCAISSGLRAAPPSWLLVVTQPDFTCD